MFILVVKYNIQNCNNINTVTIYYDNFHISGVISNYMVLAGWNGSPGSFSSNLAGKLY